MSFNHIMLDLETWDNKPTALIVSLGAVKMDLDELKLGEEFYRVIDPVSAERAGLTIGADTVRWWLQQDAEALKMYQARREEVFDLPPTLLEFGRWANHPDPVHAVWGNGATFDNAIIRNAYAACGLPAPWAYWQDHCYRTLKNQFPVYPSPRAGAKHNALEDARYQAQHLLEIVRSLRK